MHRWCCKLRSLSISSSSSVSKPSHPVPWRIRALHSSPVSRAPSPFSSVTPPAFKYLAQVRNFSAKSKEKKWKKLTPIISKVKKIKIKGYSSYKRRFRLLNDGTIRRWREGKRHNAHLKSKEAKRRLRRPSTVPVAYAKVMKKLNFCAT